MKNRKITLTIISLLLTILLYSCASYTPEQDFISAPPFGLRIQEQGNFYLISPEIKSSGSGNTDGRGVIFYPGGLVKPASYIPFGSLLALEGASVYIVKMPFDLAVLAPSRADKIRPAFPEVTEWIIGGHSLGE
ncbi:MAG: hypothetical protein JEY99_21015 [Spirochaetales bacterium]|nr:hypothetical protein [Spirochaetales bacterium]